jgi:hypothetical protein
MEVFLQRLLIELAAIALQVAIIRLVIWIRTRSAESGAIERSGLPA